MKDPASMAGHHLLQQDHYGGLSCCGSLGRGVSGRWTGGGLALGEQAPREDCGKRGRERERERGGGWGGEKERMK